MNVLDSARSRHGLDSLFVMFRAIGLDQRVAKVAPDEASEAKVLALLPPDKEELVKNHLRKFVLKDDPLTSAVGFPGVEPYLNVLPMTYREVDSALTAGMPPPILECLGGRDSRL
ncbi:MAG: hypothetical protein ACRDUX_06315 [Mycobacterium sp.]